jgi:hypothetical protein
MSTNKYELYELSVQSPKMHIESFNSMYKEITGESPHHLREDFCGTFLFSTEWVKAHDQNTALAVDLDPEPTAYGKKKHWSRLSPSQKKRVQVVNANVLKTTAKKDLIVACNFSFCIFKQRELLLKYLKSCVKSLNSKGCLILELAGGPGMIAPLRESKTVRVGPNKKFKYIWHQKSFDPITHDALFSIHFKFQDGSSLKDAFIYDWRMWTIPEVRELMKEAGFKKSCVYWESEHKGQGTGEFVQMNKGDNAYSWIAYIVGVM